MYVCISVGMYVSVECMHVSVEYACMSVLSMHVCQC